MYMYIYTIYICIYIHLQVVLVGCNYRFEETIPSSSELMIENLMLMIGQMLTITVTATNIVGESDPFQSNFTVHNIIGK